MAMGVYRKESHYYLKGLIARQSCPKCNDLQTFRLPSSIDYATLYQGTILTLGDGHPYELIQSEDEHWEECDLTGRVKLTAWQPLGNIVVRGYEENEDGIILRKIHLPSTIDSAHLLQEGTEILIGSMIYELGRQYDSLVEEEHIQAVLKVQASVRMFQNNLLLEEEHIHAVLKVQASVRMLLAKKKLARLLHLKLKINARKIQRWYRLGKRSIFECDRRHLQKCIAIIATYNCKHFGSGFYPRSTNTDYWADVENMVYELSYPPNDPSVGRRDMDTWKYSSMPLALNEVARLWNLDGYIMESSLCKVMESFEQKYYSSETVTEEASRANAALGSEGTSSQQALMKTSPATPSASTYRVARIEDWHVVISGGTKSINGNVYGHARYENGEYKSLLFPSSIFARKLCCGDTIHQGPTHEYVLGMPLDNE